MIDDGARCAVALHDGRAANGAHVNEKIASRVDNGLRAAQGDDRRVKCDIGVRVLIQMFGGRRILELVEQMPQFGDFRVRCLQRRKPGRHGFERRPHLNHFDHFALRLADDVDAAPRNGADEPFLFQQRQGFANRGAAHSKGSGELPLVKAQFLIRIVDVGVGNRVLQERIGLITETRRIQRSQRQRSCG